MSDSVISAMSDPGYVRLQQSNYLRHYELPSLGPCENYMYEKLILAFYRAYGIPGTAQHYTSATLPRTSQPKGLPHPSQILNRMRSAKSAEPELGPNLPILYNKYADDLVIRLPATSEADETLSEGTNRSKGDLKGQQTPQTSVITTAPVPVALPGGISRNRSMPPDPQRFAAKHHEDFDYWDDEFEEYYEESDYEEEDFGSRPVPIWLCSSLVIGYIVGGAYLFSSWEEWNFLDSAYFCFITLTTIGKF